MYVHVHACGVCVRVCVHLMSVGGDGGGGGGGGDGGEVGVERDLQAVGFVADCIKSSVVD